MQTNSFSRIFFDVWKIIHNILSFKLSIIKCNILASKNIFLTVVFHQIRVTQWLCFFFKIIFLLKIPWKCVEFSGMWFTIKFWDHLLEKLRSLVLIFTTRQLFSAQKPKMKISLQRNIILFLVRFRALEVKWNRNSKEKFVKASESESKDATNKTLEKDFAY